MKYTVGIAGLGVRGKIHLKGILENSDRFEIVGLCDINPKREAEIAAKFNVKAPFFTDAEEMLKQTHPDVFVFVTFPEIRTSMVDLAVKYGVRGLSFEKPMAVNIQEARYITDVCNEHGIKTVVSHQQKYTKQMQLIKGIVERGEIGQLCKIHTECNSWLAQLGTHYIDYAMWINGGKHRVKSIVGHAHGNWMLTDSHPAPDYVLGEAILENNVRIYLECGYFAERREYVPLYGYDNRMTAYGTHGYVWAETDGRYGYFTKQTKGELVTGAFEEWDIQDKHIQTPYYTQFADWMDDDAKEHPCNVNLSYHGYEVLEGLCLSALDHTRIDLPLADINYTPVLERMAREFPDVDTPRRRTEDVVFE